MHNHPSSPRIAVVGAGAIGMYYGAKLARRGFDVHFLMRSDFAAVRDRGMVIESWQGDFTLAPDQICVYDDPRKMPKADLVIVTLKATGNHLLATLVPRLLHEQTAILTMQNGLGIEEDLAAMFGAQRILGAIAFIACNRGGNGIVKHLREGFVRIGELNRPPGQRTRAIGKLFTDSGVDCTILENLARGRWEKLVWNIPFNGLGALFNETTDLLLSSSEKRQQVTALMREIMQIAEAIGITLPADLPNRMIQLTLPIGPYKTSMQIDREQGRPMEIDAIIGRPLRVAERNGIDTPRLRDLHTGLQRIVAAGGE